MEQVPGWAWLLIAAFALYLLYRHVKTRRALSAAYKDIRNARCILLAYRRAREHNLNWDETEKFIGIVVWFVRNGTIPATMRTNERISKAFDDWIKEDFSSS